MPSVPYVHAVISSRFVPTTFESDSLAGSRAGVNPGCPTAGSGAYAQYGRHEAGEPMQDAGFWSNHVSTMAIAPLLRGKRGKGVGSICERSNLTKAEYYLALSVSFQSKDSARVLSHPPA